MTTEGGRRVVIVLGMHRSGTSAVARAVSALGFDLGLDLSGSGPDNPTGFWEDREVLAVNEELFQSLGLSWACTQRIRPDLLLSLADGPIGDRARRLIESRLRSLDSWLFKDPRTIRILPFWENVLEGMDVHASRVGVVRKPYAVAKSLNRRNRMPITQGLLLWIAHNRLLVGAHDVLIDYDELLDDASAVLGKAAEGLGVARPSNAVVSVLEADFLSKDLRHSVAEEAARERKRWPMPWCEQIYAALMRDGSDLAAVDQAWSELADVLQLVDIYQLSADRMSQLAHLSGLDLDDNALPSLFARQWGERVPGRAVSDLNALAEKIGADAELLRSQRRTLNELKVEVEKRGRERDRLLQDRDSLRDEGRKLRAEVQRVSSEGLLLQADLDHQTRRAEYYESESKRLTRDVNFYFELYRRTPTARFKRMVKVALRPLARATRGLPRPIRNALIRFSSFLPSRIAVRVAASLRAGPAPVKPARPSERLRIHQALVEALREQGNPVQADVFFFPVINWEFRIQRPQHLALQLAQQGHRVFYFDTRFAPTQKSRRFTLVGNPAPNVYQVQLHAQRHETRIYSDIPGEELIQELTAGLAQLFADIGCHDRIAVIDLPFWHRIVTRLPGLPLVYDCMDFHAGFSTNSEAMLREEEQLLADADATIFTSARLRELAGHSSHSLVIRNGTDVEHFSSIRVHVPKDRPLIGYYGAISEWFDMSTVLVLAKARPDWDIVLIGSTAGCDELPERLPRNVSLRGEIPYSDLPQELEQFDVCLIPFKRVELTLCTNPVKVYEYLSAGKPVVATRLPELELIPEGLVHLADSPEEFLAATDAALAELSDPDMVEKRKEWASTQTWGHRGSQLAEVMEAMFPKVSVVVLVYNNPKLTKRCLESIDRYSNYPNLEVVIVDNASDEETRELVRKHADGRGDIHLIMNEENLGFAAGNNVGLAVATGDYLVLLNNDTCVSDGWVFDMVRHFRADKILGLVGPVTNNIGNEAKVDAEYSDMEEMLEFARKRHGAHVGQRLYNDVVAFFCVMMSRGVFERIGGLDEAFGQGFFEDDDYCNRVREAGFSIAIADDVFIHHELSASFDALGRKRKQELFERNKAIYEEKWGVWTPHRYRE